MRSVPDRSTYACKICGFENVKKKMTQSNVPVTKLGNYGDNATPTPVTDAITYYEATTVSFTAAGSGPAYLSDYALAFADNHIQCNWSITVTTTSGINDGSYTIADRGVSRGTILLSSTDSLTTESAADAGTVTIKKVSYKPNISSGCPFCGSLASR